MLQDFLANRPGAQSSSDSPAQQSTFQPFFAARAAGLPASRREIEADPEVQRLEEPEIELVHEAGQVRRIIVTCKCCERITIDCEY